MKNPTKKYVTYFLLCIVLLSRVNTLYSQTHTFKEIPDSILVKSYKSLKSAFETTYNNIELSNAYATAFLKKAVVDRDTLKIAHGYAMIIYNTDETNLVLCDSLLKYSKFLPTKESNSYAWKAYTGKADYYYDTRNFKKACDNHIKALNIAKQGKLFTYVNFSTTNLALIRERTGKYQEALIDFKKNYNYQLKRLDTLHKVDPYSVETVANAALALANSYRLNKQYDSAQYYTRKVFQYKNYEAVELYLGQAHIHTAEINFELGDYRGAIDAANQGLPILTKHNNIPNIAVGYFIRGMSYSRKNKELAIADLEKMDSIFNLNNDLEPSLRMGYTYLVDFYKEKKDLPKELYYIKQLMKLDSLVNEYNLHVNKALYAQERKKLLKTKKNLESVTTQNSRRVKGIVLSSCLVFFLIIYKINRRRRLNSKRFNEHQKRFDLLLANETSHIANVEGTTELSLSDEVINNIVAKLKTFELKKGFLDKSITAQKLAIELGTNSNYLGQVIKYKYGKSFRHYINSLRIEYALKALRENTKMLNFSIQAIAEEAGFNNTEPFSRAFKHRTGLTPSEFIHKIKNENY